jgi:predicted dehydrogenase
VRVGVIGCGLIGKRRAEIVYKSPEDELVVVADVNLSAAEDLGNTLVCEFTDKWQDVVERHDLEIIVICTTHNWLASIAIAALENNKHVLTEKPMARNAQEAEQILQVLKQKGKEHLIVKVGFNHRFHEAIWKGHTLFKQGAIGEPMFARCRYGHGGRPGYGDEWRAKPELSGGGELLDQGVHAIDLFRWFLGDFSDATGFVMDYMWTAGKGVEDNAFALFKTPNNQIASLHASWTQWKNIFSFEIFGREGYLIADGLGGHYGQEQLTWGRRKPESGPPDVEVFNFSGPDRSWVAEWDEFSAAIREKRQPLSNAHDGWQVLRMVHAVYESAEKGQVIRV